MVKKKYLVWLLLLTLVIGVAGGWAFFATFPQHYFGGYPLIPVFFLVLGLFTINMTEMCRKRMPQRMLQTYLLVRVVRMLLAIAVMAVYCVAVRHEARAFLLTFIANYLIYLTYDSWFYFRLEGNKKKI